MWQISRELLPSILIYIAESCSVRTEWLNGHPAEYKVPWLYPGRGHSENPAFWFNFSVLNGQMDQFAASYSYELQSIKKFHSLSHDDDVRGS